MNVQKVALEVAEAASSVFWLIVAVATCWMLLLGFFPPEWINGTRSGEAALPPAALLQHQSDCWTGSQKAPVEWPGAAVVRDTQTGEVVYTTDHELVDIALDNVFGKHSDLYETIALCK